MQPEPFKILFLCSDNSARSILAEAVLNHIGGERFQAASAGNRPAEAVNPLALKVLEDAGIDPPARGPESWDRYAGDGAAAPDVLITLCDDAAGEDCPVTPQLGVAAHWALRDPAAAEGDERERRAAFTRTLVELSARLRMLMALGEEDLRDPAIGSRLDDIHARCEAASPS